MFCLGVCCSLGASVSVFGLCVCVSVCLGFRPISWKSVVMLHRGCNQPVISHVHRKSLFIWLGSCLSVHRARTAPEWLFRNFQSVKICSLKGMDDQRTFVFNNASVKMWKFQEDNFTCDLLFQRRKNITCNDSRSKPFHLCQKHMWLATCDLWITCSDI